MTDYEAELFMPKVGNMYFLHISVPIPAADQNSIIFESNQVETIGGERIRVISYNILHTPSGPFVHSDIKTVQGFSSQSDFDIENATGVHIVVKRPGHGEKKTVRSYISHDPFIEK